MSSLALVNVGPIISGDLEEGLLEGDTVLVESGLFSQIGDSQSVDTSSVDVVVDVKGAAIAPGLITRPISLEHG